MTTATTAADRALAFGLALPLRYLGARAGEVYRSGQYAGAHTQPAESCDACGQSIMEVHCFVDANGREFKTGCDCVYRYLPAAYHGAVKREHGKIEKAKRDARNQAKREKAAIKAAALRADLSAAIEASREALASTPHPLAWAAKQGKTRLDWAEWMLRHGGARAHAATLVELKA